MMNLYSNVPPWQVLLACYGLCYIIQNKMDEFLGLWWVTNRLVECSFCAGVLSGCFFWILMGAPGNLDVNLLLWPFASGAFCLIADAVTKFLEEFTRRRGMIR